MKYLTMCFMGGRRIITIFVITNFIIKPTNTHFTIIPIDDDDYGKCCWF